MDFLGVFCRELLEFFPALRRGFWFRRGGGDNGGRIGPLFDVIDVDLEGLEVEEMSKCL